MSKNHTSTVVTYIVTPVEVDISIFYYAGFGTRDRLEGV